MTDPTRAVRERFARQLKTLRIPRGFKTARSFAEALGIDENRYTRYERAEVEPDLSLIHRICETLRITPNDLLILPEDLATGYSTGFAEIADHGYVVDRNDREQHTARAADVSRTTPDLSRSRGGDQKATRRRVLAWQLAARLAALSTGGETAPLKLTSMYFADIEADPFAFATRLPNEAVLTRAEEAEQQRIATMIDALISSMEESLAH